MNYKIMYAELDTIEAYNALNEEITLNSADKYKGTGTIRYAPENPEPINGKYYMSVSADYQKAYPDKTALLTLVERIPEPIIFLEDENNIII